MSAPTHPATAVYDTIEGVGLWRMRCPTCGKIGDPGPHSAAMVDSLNHRREHGGAA